MPHFTTNFQNLNLVVDVAGLLSNTATVSEVERGVLSTGGFGGSQSHLALFGLNTGYYQDISNLFDVSSISQFNVNFRTENTPELRPITINKVIILCKQYPLNSSAPGSSVSFQIKITGNIGPNAVLYASGVISARNLNSANFTEVVFDVNGFTCEKPQLNLTIPAATCNVQIHKVKMICTQPTDELL